MNLLELDNLTKVYRVHTGLLGRGQVLRALDGVSLSIPKGEIVALVGESGCGKSTLGQIVAGLQKPTGGAMRVNGKPALKGKPRARQIQIVFQDPFGSLNPKMSVGELISEPADLHGLVPRAALGRRVADLLTLVGLRPAIAERYPHELSGGQRQRVALARALAAEPELIVCDEAVSALDVSVQAQIANLLQDIQARTGISLLFISHGLSLVLHISHRVAVMYLGRIVEEGPADAVFDHPRHPYTRALLSATPEPLPGQANRRIQLTGEVPSPLDLPSGCAFRTRCGHARDRCATSAPPLKGAPHAAACWFADQLPDFDMPRTAPPARIAAALELYRRAAARRGDALADVLADALADAPEETTN
ncbi:MAG: peptide ABC transporter substrate-binding protein [Rhodobacteraceae bacterium]|nr:peptide ABC transporter substrate-binding protein [Paracoccaceae bacterium]